MSLTTGLVILATAFATSILSGIFGMAGGLILMGVLALMVPVATAMVLHGAIMMSANGWRAFLLRQHIEWTAFRRYLIGTVGAVGLLAVLAWRPDREALFLFLGLTPLLVWLPKRRMNLDIRRRGHAIAAGAGVGALNTVAGVGGPLLDLFFVNGGMGRQAVVATKSVTQVVAHLVKILFWGAPLVFASGAGELPPLWVVACALPLVFTGTWLGGLVLARMSDTGFQKWTKGLVTAIGGVFLLRAAGLSPF